MRTLVGKVINRFTVIAFCLVFLGFFGRSAGAVNNSQFISQSVPAVMTTGETLQVSVTFKNTGTSTWTQAGLFRMGSRNPAENTNWGMSRVFLSGSDSIAPNQQKTFSFNVTAPSNPGLYNFQWQMLEEGVNWFGASSANVLVQVGNGVNNSQFISQSVPTTMIAGETRQVSVTFKNTGNTTWTRADLFKLGSRNPAENTTWGMSRVNLSTSDSIEPNQQKTFTFNVTAPSNPGLYNFQWQMLKEGVNWFGPSSTNILVNVGNGVNGSQFIFQSAPTTMMVGETRQVSVTFRNTGTTIWTRAGLFKLGSRNPAENTNWGMSRVLLSTSDSIAPTQQKTFTFNVTAPSDPGLYNFQWQMLKEGVNWFGASSTNIIVQVGGGVNASEFVSQSVATLMTTGETRQVSVTFRNTGNTTWTRADLFKLGSRNPAENTTWGLSRVLLSTSDSIAPNQQKTFTFNVTAPTAPGNYNFQWQMLKEGVNWFGESSTNVVVRVAKVNASQFITQSVPSTMIPGETRQVSVRFKNTGTATWTKAQLYRLGSRRPTSNTRWGMSRVLLSTSDSIGPNQKKTFTFNITAPTAPGSYDFQWRMLREGVAWFGPNSPNKVISVGVATPRIDSIDNERVSLGTITTLVVRGANLTSDTFYIPEYEGTGRVEPTITNVNVTGGGTRANVQIDATSGATEGVWMLAAQNAGASSEEDVSASDFRVVRAGPVIDGWTPSAPMSGGISAMLIAGANLQGASVVCPNPGVTITDLENGDDDALSGFLLVDAGVDPQLISLIVSNGGISVTLTPEIIDPIVAPSTHRMVSDSPPVYIQDMTFARIEKERSISEGARFGLCFFNYTRVRFSRSFALHLNLINEFGVSDPDVLTGLGIGETRRFGVLTVVVAARLFIAVSFNYCDGFRFQYCFGGSLGIVIPGDQGFVTDFSCCFPGGCFLPTTRGTTGSLSSVSARTSAAGSDCISLTQITSPANGGRQFFDIEVLDCCPAPPPILFSISGQAFGGTSLSVVFSGTDLPIAVARIEDQQCQWNKLVVFRAFIPWKHGEPPFPSAQSPTGFLIGPGDDRFCSDIGTSFRVQQVAPLTEVGIQGFPLNIASDTILYLWNPISLQPGFPFVTLPNNANGMVLPSAQVSPDGTVTLSLDGAAETSAAWFAFPPVPPALTPKIDWCLDLSVRRESNGRISYQLTGGHDNYPAYEIFLGNQRIYCWEPSTNFVGLLLGGCEDVPVNVSGFCD